MIRGKQFARAVLLASLAAVALVPALAKAEADKTSQREYMRANGAERGVWIRRGEPFVDALATPTPKPRNPHGFVYEGWQNDPDRLLDDKIGITRQSGGTSTPETQVTVVTAVPSDVPVPSDAPVPSGVAAPKGIVPAAPAEVPVPPEVPVAPAKPGSKCSSTCHQRLDKDVVSDGFQNASGSVAQYSGTMDALKLLEDPANTTKHNALYTAGTGSYTWSGDASVADGTVTAVTGCGVCHSRAAAKQRGLDRIRGCVDCHNFNLDPAKSAEKGNLHGTHIPFLTAEIPLADPANTSGSPCGYCHGEANKPNASCWNCHLSGHWPKVPYWKATP
ncbi:MAG: hypothetical protein WDA27_06455 [Actinomycetota bacterium]